jgi:5'(3')-deoxyribonucleotidase
MYDIEYFPSRWDWSAQYLNEDQNTIIWSHVTSSSTFWTNVSTYEWTRTALNALLNNNQHEVYFITCRMTTNKDVSVKTQTEKALRKLNVVNPTVLIVKEYTEKCPLVNALHLDVFIDDRTETLNLLQEECPDTRIVCLMQPWNTEFTGEKITHLPLFISSL